MMKLLLIPLALLFGFIALNAINPALAAPAEGDNAPDFALTDTKNQTHQLSEYAGRWLILYFYPKDDTPGCTKEACHFRDDMAQLKKMGAEVVGISVDDAKSHVAFAQKYQLPFTLLSDTDGKVAEKYGALMNLGIIKIAKRYTFLINPNGKIAKTYTDVNTSKHSQEIIADLALLQNKQH